MKTILLVDDEELITEILLEAISEVLPNVAIEVATDGLQASRMLLSRTYDAVILDINLPGKSGLVILREFINRDTTLAAKTIVMSAEITPKASKDLLKFGISSVFVKPFELDQFTEKLGHIIGN